MNGKKGEKHAFLIYLLFLGLTAFYFLPLWLQPHQLPFPDINGELGQSLWNLWWFKSAFLALRNPYYCDIILYPVGANLIYHTLDPLYGMLTLPIQILFGIIPTYNLVISITFFLTLLAMYILVRDLGGGKSAGIIAALFLATAPYRFAHLHQFRPLSTFWIPLWVIFLRRTVASPPSISSAIALGLCADGLILSDWNYTVFSLWFTLFYLGYKAINGVKWWRSVTFWRNALITSLVIAPLIVFFGMNWLEAKKAGLSAQFELAIKVYWSADLLNYFIPPYLGNFFHRLIYGATPSPKEIFWSFKTYGEFAIFPGTVLWLLVVLILILRRAAKKSLWWLVAATAFAILSFGPLLKISRPLIFGDYSIFMPGYFLHYAPFIGLVKHLSRYGFMTLFCLITFVAVNWRDFCSWLQNKLSLPPALFATLIIALLLLENWKGFILPYPARMPEFYQRLSTQPGDFAILEFPLDDKEFTGRYMFYQTRHKKRLIGGYISRGADNFALFLERFELYQLLQKARENKMTLSLTAEPKKRIVRELAQLNLRYLVIHSEFMSAAETSAVNNTLKDLNLFTPEWSKNRYLSIWRTSAK